MDSLRIERSRKGVNRFDPIYWFLNHVVFGSLFRPPKQNQPGKYETLEQPEIEFLLSNLNKHRNILWINLLAAALLATVGLGYIAEDSKEVVISGLLAPAMITGTAWYAVSFGGIGEKFLSIAVDLTFAMFLAFTLSMTLLTTLLVSISPVVGGGVVM